MSFHGTVCALLSDNMSKTTSKTVVKSSCKAICVDFVGPYTLKGKVRSQIGLICLTMIEPGSSWFEIVELQVLEYITPPSQTKKGTKTHQMQQVTELTLIKHKQ
jgi:hypothetical protein